ncbi:hypothetical protein BKA70DRAFT_1415896 [Coprinopsis sp. MPI-PUGE-AT-0042]|nr:hypothetical protein BKA70DRAFT_1415896 [Coprinopsis sp. MPI-PUGE-AT-0042]
MPFDLNNIRKQGDTVMEGGCETDIVILVMGPTWAGKTAFVQSVLQSWEFNEVPEALPAWSWGSEWRVKAHIAPLPQKFAKFAGQRLVLVDTPGFGNLVISDSEILRRIGVWLASSFVSRMKIGGVIYMCPVFPPWPKQNDRVRMKVLQLLCGKDALPKVHMVTTKWSLYLDPSAGESREEQFRSNSWKELLDGGAEISRLHDSETSADKLLADVLTKYRRSDEKQRQLEDIFLDIQREIVENLCSVAETAAGQELKAQQQRSLLEHREKEHRAEPASGDPHMRRRKLQNIAAQPNGLKISLSESFKNFFNSRETASSHGRQVVLIIGEIGVGKSTFINNLADAILADVTDELEARGNISYHDIDMPGTSTKATFVDCPGYDDERDGWQEKINTITRNCLQ